MQMTQATMVNFQRPDGQQLRGYLARPTKSEGAPAIVIIQEWWGLNEQIRGVADRFAQSGYIALVPDLYRGKMTFEQEEAHHLMDSLNFSEAVSQDIRGAVQYLQTQSAEIAVTGFCMGGALTLLSLAEIPELSAGVIWYGCPPLDYVNPANIKVPVLAHWATQDAFFAIDTIDELELRLRAAEVNYESHRYLAHHAFANETAVGTGRIPNTQFDPVWAQMAWDRTLTFLARTLWKKADLK